MPVTQSNLELLTDFLQQIGSSSKSFRYYSKRDASESIRNHIMTLLLVVGGEMVAYGHLDRDGDVVWLGICVAEKHIGKGYGKMMMNELTTRYRGDIVLSTDLTNQTAISLYGKFGFTVTRFESEVVYMKRKCY